MFEGWKYPLLPWPLMPWISSYMSRKRWVYALTVVVGVTVRETATPCVSAPDVPVTVTVLVPVAAAIEAVRLSTVLAPVVLAGLKAAVTPAGRPVAANETAPVKPPVRVMVMVQDALPPRTTIGPGEHGDSEKSCAVGMVTPIVVVRVSAPLVQVMVTVVVPDTMPAGTASVRMLDVPVIDAGLNVPVTPAGCPLMLQDTVSAKPPVRVTVNVVVPDAPAAMLRLVGLAASVKSAAAITERFTVAVRVKPPLVPVMVTTNVPTAAVLVAVNVATLLLPVADEGLNAALTPVGSPLAVKATAPVKFERAMLRVAVALPPTGTLTAFGVLESVKSAGNVTVRPTVVV